MKLTIRIVFIVALLSAINMLFITPAGINRAMPMILNQTADSRMQRELCQTPVLWRIGSLDPAFDLTAEQAEQVAHEAAQLWNTALNREIFRYDSLDGFAIDFEHNGHQQRLLQQALQKSRLYQTSKRSDIRDETLQQQQQRLMQRSMAYQQEKNQLDSDMAALEMHFRNAGQQDQFAYQQQQASLKQRQQQLAYEKTALEQQYDQLAREKDYRNSMKQQQSTITPKQQSGAELEFGEMEFEDGQRSMTILAYHNSADLRQTIAHQFGHALGLGHNTNKASVMADMFNPANTDLSSTDIRYLKDQCAF